MHKWTTGTPHKTGMNSCDPDVIIYLTSQNNEIIPNTNISKQYVLKMFWGVNARVARWLKPFMYHHKSGITYVDMIFDIHFTSLKFLDIHTRPDALTVTFSVPEFMFHQYYSHNTAVFDYRYKYHIPQFSLLSRWRQ